MVLHHGDELIDLKTAFTHLSLLWEQLGTNSPFHANLCDQYYRKPETESSRNNDMQEKSYRWTISNVYEKRHFIRTRNGFIGQAPDESRIEDKLALLSGATTPYILRPTGSGTYFLIGEAYVHGTMFGELIEGRNAGKWPDLHEQEIVLV
jgi:hypothetical protein